MTELTKAPLIPAQAGILLAVMAGHSRPKDGVLLHAYVPAIHVFVQARLQDVDARDKRGHDVEGQ